MLTGAAGGCAPGEGRSPRRGRPRPRASGAMDLRSMQDDEVVVVKDDAEPQSAWPAWKHLLEDLAEASPPPSTLKLAYKNLGDAGVCRLAELLRGPLQRVTVLDLSCTSMGSAGASTLAGALAGNSSLRALDVSSNAVTDVGAIALAKTLDANTTLESLSLHACLIGDKGAAALAATLQRGSVSLAELNLRQNYIGDAGAKALAAAIAAPACRLRVCDVQNNSYGVPGKTALNEAYKSTQGRVDRAMPLSWHVGASVAAGGAGAGCRGAEEDSSLSRLARPPRSLVSVESAESRLTKTRKAKPPAVGNGTGSHGHAQPHTPASPLARAEGRTSLRETPRSAGDRLFFDVTPPSLFFLPHRTCSCRRAHFLLW